MFEFADLPRPVLRHLNGLWRRRWLVVAVVWGVSLLGWFAVWLLPDKYESRAHVFVQTETILEPVFTGFTARPDYAQRVEVMRLQLLTRPNVEEVILRAGLGEEIRALTALERRAKMEGLVADLSDAIMIDSPRDMYFIISYRHSDPETARRVVDAVLNMLIEQDLGASLSEDAAARRRLALQIEQFEEKLTANERAVAAFQREHAAELAATQGTARSLELKESELVRVGAEIERTRGRVLTLQNILSATPRTNSRGELDRLRVELSALRSQYREDHPDIRGVKARIEQLEKSSEGALSANPDHVRLRSELQVAQDLVGVLEAREATIREELNALDQAAGAAPLVEAELRQIIREYEQTRKTYEELLARRDRLDLTTSLGPGGRGVEYQIFERPEAALLPSDPPRFLLIVGVLFLAAGAGGGAAALLTALDRSYTQADELQKAFGLTVLGAISEAPSQAVVARNRLDYRRLAAAGGALAAVAGLYVYVAVMRLPAEIPAAGEQSVSVPTGSEALL